MRALILAVAGLAVSVTACSSNGTSVEVQRIPVAAVSVSLPSPSLVEGQRVRALATARDAAGATLPNRPITWQSSSSAIASVTDSGDVSALSPGSVTISATSEGQSGSASLSVTAVPPVPVASVSVALAASSRNPGQTTQATATTRDANNNVLTGRSITWSSSNTGVATVSPSGLVSALAVGTAQISATSEGQTGSATLTVVAPLPVPVASVSVTLGSSSLNPGLTTQATATTRDANNNILTGRAIVWGSSNQLVATVSTSGLVTAVAVGTAQITATSESQSGSAGLSVVAVPPPPPPGSVEPAGMTPITERPFSALNEAGWTDQASPYLTIVSDATAPKSPPGVIQMLFPAGFLDGSSPAVSEAVLGTRYRTIYVSFWMKYSSNWIGHDTGTNKILHFWVGGVNRIYNLVQGVGTGPLVASVDVQGVITGGQYDGGTNGKFAPNLGVPGIIPRGQWVHWEMVFTGNTAGNADGTIEWWLDGAKLGSYGGVQFVSGNALWESMEWSPTWGGNSGIRVPADQYSWLDHIYISGKN
ncbi:MAG: hypothetical protein DMD63_14435 [Gemmatimonadetes bacterium]|nr:MAG: hypothetical protein DMD63_14435 [Gemmatimonadota bacterium]